MTIVKWPNPMWGCEAQCSAIPTGKDDPLQWQVQGPAG